MSCLQKLLTEHFNLVQRIKASSLPKRIKIETQHFHEQVINLFGEPTHE